MNAPLATEHILPEIKPLPAESGSYASEVRFGTVLYGGVSLAIYINGVVREMYEMVRATPKVGPAEKRLHSTAEIYRRISWLHDNESLRQAYCERIKSRGRTDTTQVPKDVWFDQLPAGAQPTRMVVDVISGSSAGGINGIFLAAALANDAPDFDALRKLWINEGDIGVLLNDKRSYENLGIDAARLKEKSKTAPKSLLNSERMYLKLFNALKQMNLKSSEGFSQPERSLVDELDLFVTTTDIAGSRIPLRLYGQVVHEKRHKQNFHFSYSTSRHCDDFTDNHCALLAFAARCTSSFPFAFEPMTMQALHDLQPNEYEKIKSTWRGYLSSFPNEKGEAGTYLNCAFGDGGYLDNKPFTYVAKTLAIRQSLVPVERKLVYVEPDPEQISKNGSGGGKEQPPDAFENSMAALFGIPRYETIREDLQEVLSRNRSIERVDHIVREGERDLREHLKGEANPFLTILKTPQGEIPPWPDLKRDEMTRLYGPAYLAYRRMRVASVTDELAYAIARLWKLDFTSDQFYALTALLRTWRKSEYEEEQNEEKEKAGVDRKSINIFLASFDLEFRIRRLSFLLRHIDHWTRLIKRRISGPFIDEATHNLVSGPGQDKRILSDQDRRAIGLFLKKHIDLKAHAVDSGMLVRAISALTRLKLELNNVQEKLRSEERKRRSKSSPAFGINRARQQELEMLLLLILGENVDRTLLLHTRLGQPAPIRLSEVTVKACACTRTLRENVIRRAEDVFNQMQQKDNETLLFDAFNRSIESLRLAVRKPDHACQKMSKEEVGTYDVLGRPKLKLVRQSDEATGVGLQHDILGCRISKSTRQEKDEEIGVEIHDVAAAELNTFEGKAIRSLLGEEYIYFDLFDQMSFPLYHDAGIGEPATVDVIRISPEDAKSLINEKEDERRKLAGTALANFGAFLNRHWRCNDAMWGRLDGAERLIGALLPMEDLATQTVRKELIEMAHRVILRETLLREKESELTELLYKLLENCTGKEESTKRIETSVRHTRFGKTDQQLHWLASELASFANEQRLVDYVRTRRNVDRSLDPHETFESMARGVNITGQMLEEFGQKHVQGSSLFRWVARIGQLVHGLVSISLPGTIKGYWLSHLLWMFSLSQGLLLLFAHMLGANDNMRVFLWISFGITTVILIATLAIRIAVKPDTPVANIFAHIKSLPDRLKAFFT